MLLSLSEIKGRAVCYMNAHPEIPLSGGNTLPRNFIIEVECAWGHKALRFGPNVHLLAVPPQPLLFPGTDGGYVVLSTSSVEVQCVQHLLSEPEHPVDTECVSLDIGEAITAAANTASAWEFTRRTSSSEYQAPPMGEIPAPVRQALLAAALDDAPFKIKLPLRDSISEQPPSPSSFAPVLRRARKAFGQSLHGESWDNFALEVVRSRGKCTLKIAGSYEAFHARGVPAALFEGPDCKDSRGSMAGIVLVERNSNYIDAIVSVCLPYLPVRSRRFLGVFPTWNQAVIHAARDWVSGLTTEYLRRVMSERTG